MDQSTPRRTFKDREEWKVVIEAMQKAEVFTYSAESDTITLPMTAAPAAGPEDVEG